MTAKGLRTVIQPSSAGKGPAGRFRVAAALLMTSWGLLGTGCFGYLTGSYDVEVQRLRTIVAELEAKNAALAEECLGLRGRVRDLERSRDVSSAGGGPGTDAGLPDASSSDAGLPDASSSDVGAPDT